MRVTRASALRAGRPRSQSAAARYFPFMKSPNDDRSSNPR